MRTWRRNWQTRFEKTLVEIPAHGPVICAGLTVAVRPVPAATRRVATTAPWPPRRGLLRSAPHPCVLAIARPAAPSAAAILDGRSGAILRRPHLQVVDLRGDNGNLWVRTHNCGRSRSRGSSRRGALSQEPYKGWWRLGGHGQISVEQTGAKTGGAPDFPAYWRGFTAERDRVRPGTRCSAGGRFGGIGARQRRAA